MLIGYSRISSASQDHSSQMDALERAGCQRIFVETMTGTRADRPELEKLLEFARPGDQLAVYRLDRLSRSLRDLLNIMDRLERLQIGLTSLSEAIDTTSPSGRLAVHMLAALGQHEVESIRARCAAGRAAAIARGRMGGRPRALDQHKLRVARALMADSELSMAEIARQVGCAPSTLYRTLPGGRGASTAASTV